MYLGTNDVGAQHKTADIIAAFTTLVKNIRDSNPKMKIIVSFCFNCRLSTHA
jgi:hypothetical protein